MASRHAYPPGRVQTRPNIFGASLDKKIFIQVSFFASIFGRKVPETKSLVRLDPCVHITGCWLLQNNNLSGGPIEIKRSFQFFFFLQIANLFPWFVSEIA